MKYALVIWLCMGGSSCAGAVQAHERSESTSHWTFADGELHGVVTARTREVTRLTIPGDNYASLAQIFSAHVERSVAATVDGTACTPHRAPAILESEPGYLRVDVTMRCKPGDLLGLKVDIFFTVAPSHHHFLYAESAGTSREAILTAAAPTAQLELRPTGAGATHFLQFIRMGIEHIATGIDHLAFLLALLIGARTSRQVLAIVTGFTLGHSLTLGLAVLGIVQANRGAVECLIGLTIALAAAQNLVRGEQEGRFAGLATLAILGSLLLVPSDLRPDMPAALIIAMAVAAGSAVWLASTRRAEFSIPSRFAMAMGFGWVHGLGFAGALQDLHLPRAGLAATLLGFNVGVEVGQLLVVVTAVALIKLVGTLAPVTSRRSDMSAAMASAVLLAARLAWFLTRAVVVG
jgi:hypothetical protein